MSFAKLRSEISQLEKLYFASRLASEELRADLKNSHLEGSIDLSQPIGETSFTENYTPPNGFSLAKYTKRDYLRGLREVIIVRLVSTLEVFLVDTVSALFMTRKDLFTELDKIDFHARELLQAKSISELWMKLVNRECRKVQSMGFSEVKRFYLKSFGIDFGKSQASVKFLNELHDKRHLLVHRLGKTDNQFRHKYNTNDARIKIDEPYLLTAFKTILKFSSFVDSEAMELSKQSRPPYYNPRSLRMRLDLIDIDQAALPVLDENSYFPVPGIGLVKLGDILSSHLGSTSEATLILEGPTKTVRAYLKVLKRQQANRLLIIQDRTILSQGHQCNLTDEEVNLVVESLPQRPWPRHIHKKIAQDLGFSNKQVTAAIDLILYAPEYFGAQEKI